MQFSNSALRVADDGSLVEAYDRNGRSTGGKNTLAYNSLYDQNIASNAGGRSYEEPGDITPAAQFLQPQQQPQQAAPSLTVVGGGATKPGILASAEKPQTRPPEVATPATPPSTPQQLGLPATWKITPDQTVEGRIGALTDPNNPFIQQARSRADGRSNERGLLNSSMALTAADSAAYDAAMPIATADAANASKVAGYNTGQLNEFALARLSNDTNRYGIDTTASTQKYAANLSADTQKFTANLSADTQKFTANLSADTQMKIKQLDGDQQALITKVGNDNRVLLQNSNVGSSAFSTYTQTVYNNSVNKDMSPEAREIANQNAWTVLQQGLKLGSSLLNVPDVSNLLTFPAKAPPKDPTKDPVSPPPPDQGMGGGRPGKVQYIDSSLLF